MQFNLDKNLIGNIVILVSLILLLVCVAMEVNMMTESAMNMGGTVEWNGIRFSPPSDVKAEVTADTLTFDSPYDSHDMELKKTTDQTNFNKYIGGENIYNGCWNTPYNDTHTMFVNDAQKFAIIIANDDFDDSGGSVVLKGNPNLIEVTFNNVEFMLSASYPTRVM